MRFVAFTPHLEMTDCADSWSECIDCRGMHHHRRVDAIKYAALQHVHFPTSAFLGRGAHHRKCDPEIINERSKDRSGTGEVRLVGLELRDLEGRPISTVWSGQDVEVCLYLENYSAKTFPALHIDFVVKNQLDLSCVAVSHHRASAPCGNRAHCDQPILFGGGDSRQF